MKTQTILQTFITFLLITIGCDDGKKKQTLANITTQQNLCYPNEIGSNLWILRKWFDRKRGKLLNKLSA